MTLFYFGILILLIISLIELNPKRFKKGFAHLQTDKNSGFFLTVSSFLVGLGSILDRLFNLLIFQTSFNNTIILVGIILLIFGFLIRYVAIRELGDDFNYAVASIRRLRTERIYKIIRHPCYLGTLVYSISIPMIFSSGVGFILAIFVFISIIYRINIEERFLEKSLKSKYSDYEKNTYRLVPYLY